MHRISRDYYQKLLHQCYLQESHVWNLASRIKHLENAYYLKYNWVESLLIYVILLICSVGVRIGICDPSMTPSTHRNPLNSWNSFIVYCTDFPVGPLIGSVINSDRTYTRWIRFTSLFTVASQTPNMSANVCSVSWVLSYLM